MPLQPTTARQRRQEKTMLVLRFLRTTIYSSADILGRVMGLTDRAGIYKTLKGIEQQHLIQCRRFADFGGITLWGITGHGQDKARFDGEEEDQRTFNPSKISARTLFHYLDIQRAHIQREQIGWTSFEYLDHSQRKKPFSLNHKQEESQYSAKADLLATTPEGIRAAIEVEITLKAECRYRDSIIPGHVRKLNAKEYQFVLWVCRSQEQQQNLTEILKRVVEKLRADNKWYLDVPKTNYKLFQFAHLANWPNF